LLIRYFASLREQLGIDSEQLDSPATSVEQLINELSQRGELWQQLLANNNRLQIAVNQAIARRSSPLQPEDEVAFFPPVTGG
jgi:molybdopterin synthase sulfur carrier subunit